jgi:hypothetical protein
LLGPGEQKEEGTEMKKVILFGGILAAMLCLSVTASAQWFDDFDTYTPGPLSGQGGWEIWAGGNDATVTALYSYTSPNSVMINPLTDAVHRYTGYTSGMWTYKAWVYIPSTYAGQGYFIMTDMYQPPTYQWCVQCWYGETDNMFHGNAGSSADTIAGPYTRDTWGQIQVLYYFDDDWMTIFYNGHVLDDAALADHPTLGPGYKISGGVFGGSGQLVALEAVDLFSDTGTEYYYDSLSLGTMMPWLDIKCNGQDKGVQVAAGTNAKLDFSLIAGIGTGYAVDVWVVMQTPLGFYCYDGSGPVMGWNKGLSNAYNTGALGNTFDTPLDFAAPKGSYKAYIAIDTVANGVLDRNKIYASDVVDFVIK